TDLNITWNFFADDCNIFLPTRTGKTVAFEKHQRASMDGNGKDHTETSDLKQLLASRCARTHGEVDEQQGAEPTRTKPGDQKTTTKVQASSRQGQEKSDGAREHDTY